MTKLNYLITGLIILGFLSIPLLTIGAALSSTAASVNAATTTNSLPIATLKNASKTAKSNDSSKSWHIVEIWSFTLSPLVLFSFKDVLDRLQNVEDRIDDGSDDPQDKWGEIKRRINAIANIKKIVSKKIHRVYHKFASATVTFR